MRKIKKIDRYTIAVIFMGVISFSVATASITNTLLADEIISASQSEIKTEDTLTKYEDDVLENEDDIVEAKPEQDSEKEDNNSEDNPDTESSNAAVAESDNTNQSEAPSADNNAQTTTPTAENLSGSTQDTTQNATVENATAEQGSTNMTATSTATASTKTLTTAENIAEWKSKNSDVIGWLKIPGTNIDYPVVVGPHNMYYESLGYDKTTDKNGVIWADSDTKFGDSSQISKNTVLYGHNWTNVSNNPKIGSATDVMFAQLAAFHHLNFAKNTPYIHYSTENEDMVWQVFAAFYTEIGFNYIISDGDANYMSNLISEARARSLHDYDVEVNSSDKVLTLSTCTRAYGSSADQRFVVMAKLIDPSEATGSVEVTANTDFKKPTL